MSGRVHSFLGADSGADACKACGNSRAMYLHDVEAPGNLVPLYRQPDEVRAARLQRFVGELVQLVWEPYRGGDRYSVRGRLVAAPTFRSGTHLTLAVVRLLNGAEYAYSSAQVWRITGVVRDGEEQEPEL